MSNTFYTPPMSRQRRLKPLYKALNPDAPTIESAYTPSKLIDHGQFLFERDVDKAMWNTNDVESLPLRHLPVPVRFRASGALRAWQEVLKNVPGMVQVRAALADPGSSPEEAHHRLHRAVANCLIVDEDKVTEGVCLHTVSLLNLANEMLCFWLRKGALYEPSSALDTLLGRSDISQELTLKLLSPPASTLCIVPSPQQRAQCAGASAITVFEQRATDNVPRKLAIGLHVPGSDGRVYSYQIFIDCANEDMSLFEAVEKFDLATLRVYASNHDTSSTESVASLDQLKKNWKQIFDYLAKVLLYLKLDNAIIDHRLEYSNSPRVFPGLGKRKRELKLAEIEQLYDRYIVGPASLPEPASAMPGESEAGTHEVSAHWRRGHFKSQVHGPQGSLCKVIFIAPVLVRADKLANVG